MSQVTWQPFEDVLYAAADPPHGFHYLPTGVTPQRDARGDPQVRMLVAGQSAFLQLAAQWDPAASVVERLREHLAELGGPVVLAAPPLVMGEALLLADGELLQSVVTSGYPPWVALFAIALDGAARSAAGAALHGELGRLTVRFHAELGAGSLDLHADAGSWFARDHGDTAVVAGEGIAGLQRFDHPSRSHADREGDPHAEDR